MKTVCPGFILFGSLVFALTIAPEAQAHSLRYFTQPAVAGSQTPYGDNKSAGAYVQSGDSKIYYETYGS